MQPCDSWDELDALANDDTSERQALPHEKAMIINIKIWVFCD